MSIETDLTNDAGEAGEPIETSERRGEQTADPFTAPEQVVEVRRRAGLAVALGAGASLTAVAYLARAVNGGGHLDWTLTVVLGVIGAVELAALVDARTPLLVADQLGVRLRLGRTWVGLPWAGLQVLEHRPRRGWRDGCLVARPTCLGRVLEDLDPAARRIARANRRLRGAPLATPLGLATRVVGAGPDLTATLRALADGRATVLAPAPASEGEPIAEEAAVDEPADVADREGAASGRPAAVVTPEGLPVAVPVELPVVVPAYVPADEVLEGDAAVPARRLRDPRPTVALWISAVAARFDRAGDEELDALDNELDDELGDGYVRADEDAWDDVDPVAEIPLVPPLVASRTPEPARDTVPAARADLHHEIRVPLDDDTQVWDALRAEPAVRPDLEPELQPDLECDAQPELPPLVLDDHLIEPPAEPVIGPELAAARTRLGLSVDQLAERTRIRPHVIEALEVDDFSACGGDFYARGHLRTLARVLGLDVVPLLAAYDERYADAPIDPRRVFEAELAGAGSIRATRGGPNWSVLVAAVMALILCWSVARLATGGTAHVEDRAVLSGSGGPNHVTTTTARPIPVTLTATTGGARVVVRDGNDRLVFVGDLALGQSHALRAAPPVQIQSTDGSVRVTVAGHDRGRMGPAGRPATQSYVVR